MSTTDGLREWTMQHGVEKLLDLPWHRPLPSDLPEAELRNLLPESAVMLEPTKKRRKKAKAKPGKAEVSATGGPVKDSWNDEEKATLDLHCTYWLSVWSMNNFRLYNLYKKHLPANQRPDVDRLCDASAKGDEGALRDLVKSILARMWDREEWENVIRDPKLLEGDDPEWPAVREWLARISSSKTI